MTTREPGPLRRARTALTVATAGILCTAFSVGVGVGAPPPHQPLTRHQVSEPAPVEPARPCTRVAATAPASTKPAGAVLPVTPPLPVPPAVPPIPAPPPVPPGPPPAGVEWRFDPETSTLMLVRGQGVTLPALAEAVANPEVLREVAPGEWLLTTDLALMGGTSLEITAPTARWLKLASFPDRYASVRALGGGLDIAGSCVTSWDMVTNAADTDHENGRGFLLARDGSSMNIDDAELRYLGNADVESYGIAWRTEGTTGRITHSVVSNNYFGLYSHEVGGLVIADNEIHHNVLYGVDPHTGSHNMTIERNVVHDNGKHGIILAEDCVDNVIRDNVSYRNAHHGIVLYQGSDRNIVQNNDAFANVAQGINVNESSDNVLRGNRVYDNGESGIGITQLSERTVVEGNQARGNQQDGIRVVSEAAESALRANTIGENVRYGIYVDVDGPVDIAGNSIFGNQSGIMIKGTAPVPEGDNTIYDNAERAVVID